MLTFNCQLGKVIFLVTIASNERNYICRRALRKSDISGYPINWEVSGNALLPKNFQNLLTFPDMPRLARKIFFRQIYFECTTKVYMWLPTYLKFARLIIHWKFCKIHWTHESDSSCQNKQDFIWIAHPKPLKWTHVFGFDNKLICS